MSDHSTGSSGSSTNSWTILSPEEAAVETVGPDDGTESLSGVPGLPEEGTGVPIECDLSGSHAPVGPVLSEEGHQICQETSPEICEAEALVGPSFSGYDEGEFDPEIHAPIIHDTITSSPPDSDLLGSTPFAITSEAALLFSEEEPAFAPPSSDLFADIGYGHEIPIEEFLTQERSTPEVLSEGSASPEAIPEESHTPEPFPQQSPSPEAIPEESHIPEPFPQQSPSPEALAGEGPAPEVVALETASPETLIPESIVPEAPLERSHTPDLPLSDAPEAPEFIPQESRAPEPQTERSPTPEPPPTDVAPDVSSAPVAPEVISTAVAPAPELVEALSQSVPSYPPSDSPIPAPESVRAEVSPAPVGLEPETITSASVQLQEEEEEEEEEEEPPFEDKEAEVPEEEIVEPEGAAPVEEVIRPELAGVGDGLRLRRAMPPEPLGRSSEDEEEEEEEFHLAERREEKRGFALNKLIVGSLVLLCLGSLFFSDDGFDGSEVTEQELLERLAQENQQIAKLETQLQSQKEALDQALQAATENIEAGGEALKEENVKLKEELATLPGLKEELESLRARVAELSHLTVWESETIPASADPVTPPDQPETANQIPAVPEQGAEQEDGGDGLKAALQRQKSLLEDSRRRLALMKKSVGKKKGVREGLVDMQKRLSEQAERLDKRHDWKRKQHENKAMKDQGKKWEGKKGQGNQWGGKKERDERWEDKNRQSSQWESKKAEHTGQKGGKKEHGNKWEGKKEESEKWRGERDGKHGKDGKEGEQSKSWKKYHEDWDGRKHERKMEREKRKSQREWDAKSFKKSSSRHDERNQDLDSHEKQSGRKHEHGNFWKHQEQKLRRNPGPAQACSGAAQCAEAEGLIAVELSEFQALLEGYLGKLPASTSGGKEELQRLLAGFFLDGVFDHERLLFSDFAEDVADILEDLADVLENESLEEEMEEFEREALWKFAAAAA